MNSLHEAFRHNAWATKELLAFCRGRSLSEEQLTSSATGSFGGIRATFNHVVRSDAGYLRSLTGDGPPWATDDAADADLDQLEAWADETERGWDRFVAGPVDAERIIVLDAGAYEAHAGVIVAQALHHANAHREQICTILTGLGMEAPDIQAWAYADATGRGRERVPER